jgi:hypothetical protein
MKAIRAGGLVLLAFVPVISFAPSAAGQEVPDSAIRLTAETARLKTAARLKLETIGGVSNVGWWTSTEDEIGWRLAVPADGDYRVTATVSCARDTAGSIVRLDVGGQQLSFAMPDTGEWSNFRDLTIGTLALKSGAWPVTVKAVNVSGPFVGNLRSLVFTRAAPTRADDQQEAAAASLKNRFIWVMGDGLYNQADVDAVLSYSPELVMRAWFKWGKASAWRPPAAFIKKIQAAGALFGGGGTFSALYPDEVDKATLERFVDRNPKNEPERFAHHPEVNYFHGDVQKKEYLDFALSWVDGQIDAGVDTLFLDEVSGAPSWHTGFSDNGMAEFRKYLIEKYGDGQGWTDADARWRQKLDIDLKSDAPDGTIRTFDYRRYLVRKGYADDPGKFDFPLKREWGDIYDYVLADTYLNRRNQTAWRYAVDSIRAYCAKKGRTVTLAANGFNDFVDYQIEGVWWRWKTVNGRLDVSPSYLGNWRDVIDKSDALLGRRVPLAVFHDWGFGMPFFDQIGDADRILWLRVYAPEVFAAGGIFVWPLVNCGGQYRSSSAVAAEIRKLIAWYSANRRLYLGARWVGSSVADLRGADKIVQAVTDVASGSGKTRLVHLINKKLDAAGRLAPRTGLVIGVPCPGKVESVRAYSPDFGGAQSCRFSWDNGRASITLDSLEAYVVLELQYR